MARGYLNAQGTIGIVLSLALLFAPQAVRSVWPWPIPVLLAQIYGAPFLSYGVGSLYAARQKTWAEIRIPVLGTLVFTVGVLVASLLHAELFDVGAPSAWVWFGGFGLSSFALLLLATVPSLRERS